MKIGLLGFGRYRNALIEGSMAAGSFSAKDLLIFDVDKAKLNRFVRRHPGCRAVDQRLLLKEADVLVVGHITNELAKALSSSDAQVITENKKKIYISIDALLPYPNPNGYKIVHILNNYATRVNKGVTGVYFPPKLAKERKLKKIVVKLFGKTGLLVFVNKRKDLLRVRMAAGSAVGLLCYFSLELQRAGAAYMPGMKLREKLVKEAFLGVAELLNSGMSFEEIFETVQTPGGPTEAFLRDLKKIKVGETLRKTANIFFAHKYLYDE